VDRVHLQCSYAGRWKERNLLAEVPGSIEILAGIAAERLLVSSSCGCGRMTPEQARALMTNLVAAARSA